MKPIENIFGFDCGTCEFERAESIAFGDIVNGKYWMVFQSFIEPVLNNLKKEK